MRKAKLWIVILILLFSGLVFSRPASASAKVIVNPKTVYSYTRMVSDITKLKAAYPGLVNTKIIGKSEYGRNIYAVSLGNGSAKVFINGAHHAREWLTTNLNMYMIDQYAQAYIKKQKINGYDVRSIINTSTIWFVPMVNPDGVTLQQIGVSAFPKKVQKSLIKMNNGSKNFKRWKANAKGIDLNRQYAADWKYIKSPKTPSYMNYKGNAPAQARETKSILNFVTAINPEMSISYHSSGRILYWNYKQDKARYKRDLNYAKQIGRMTGYRLVYPGKNQSGGGFTDWFISVKKHPAFTPEIAQYAYETNVPLSQFSQVWKENKGVGLYVAQESTKLLNNRLVSNLKVDYQRLQTNSKKLQVYYSTNIKNESNLKVEKAFTDLYNAVKYQNNRLNKQQAKLPLPYRKQLERYQKEISLQLTKSTNFINGIKEGENLQSLQKALLETFENGTLDSNTVSSNQQFINAISSMESAITKMDGVLVKQLAINKFITPAKMAKENTMYELSKYQLTIQIEDQLQAGNIDIVQQMLIELGQLEQDMIAFKENRNILYPGRYYLFPKTEQMLLDKKEAIKTQLANLNMDSDRDPNL